jgi:hypothetical protein
MALYMLEVSPISRAKGGCATAAAAYRAGERIRDERTRMMHDFAYREDVVHKEILLPSHFSGHADMDWARDRATLWNEVERTDRRNARVGREVLVVLPEELTPMQRVQLARRFGQELADRFLGAVDATIHLPRAGSDERNHHAHLLMTTRRVTPEGIGARTILEQSGTELHALGLGPSRNELLLTRERWAQLTNEALREGGLDVRVDHRSLKERGIDREPAPQIPHKIFCIERATGKPTEVGNAIRASYRERVEARLKGPEELARVVQRQKEEARQRAVERARQKAAQPQRTPRAMYTAEERAQKRHEQYWSNEALRERNRVRCRKYRQAHAEVLNQKKREARARARPSPEQLAAQRWLKLRERHQELELKRGRKRKREGRESDAILRSRRL